MNIHPPDNVEVSQSRQSCTWYGNLGYFHMDQDPDCVRFTPWDYKANRMHEWTSKTVPNKVSVDSLFYFQQGLVCPPQEAYSAP